MLNELTAWSAVELAARIRRRVVSPVEAVEGYLERIERINPKLNAYILVLADEARSAAKLAEKALMNGQPLGPLHGVPVAIKDLFDFKAGVKNTFGSKVFAQFVPPQSATYVRRLEEAGAIILGKTNTPEFGHKGVTDNLLWGPTSTPFDLGRNAGGSSGGSAAAMAMGLAALTQGSDAGGSIRIPAAWCGVYGLKASYGRVASASRPNAFLSHTPFIHAGPITRTVEDAALMLSVMAGPDDRDPMSLPPAGECFLEATRRSIRGMRIAYSPDWDVFEVEPGVAKVVAKAVRAFEEAGAIVEEVKVGLELSQQELAELWMREMAMLYAEVHEMFRSAGVDLLGSHRAELSPGLAKMFEEGGRPTALQTRLDDWKRSQVFDAVQNVFAQYDLLVTPTLSCGPVVNATDGNTLGPAEVNGRRMERQIGWCMTHMVNYTGHPAASIPAGLDEAGLPVGMQIIGRRFADAAVLAASAAFERVRPWAWTYQRLEEKLG